VLLVKLRASHLRNTNNGVSGVFSGTPKIPFGIGLFASEYRKFDGITIPSRKDLKDVNKICLEYRWDLFQENL
jgi:hypothetical protein